MKRTLLTSAALTAFGLLCTPSFTWAQNTQPPAVTAQDGGAFSRARKAYADGDLATARTEMEKAIATMPEDADANAWMGFILVKTTDHSRAVPFLEKALAKKPDSVDNMTNLGNALLLKSDRTAEDTDRAIELFEKVAQKKPDSAEAHFNLGYASARKKDFARAATAYRKSSELKPTDGQTFINLGIALQSLGKLDEAAQAMRTGISNNTGDKAAHAALGSIEVQRRNYSGAVMVLETARKLDANNYGVLVNLAYAYSKMARSAEAATVYGMAADLAANGAEGAPANDVTARYNQGVLLGLTGNTDGALTAYEKALGVNPRYLDALLNAGYLHFTRAAYAEAASRFKAATELDGNSFVAWLNLGTACQKQGDGNGAILAWQKAAALNTSDYDVRSYLAGELGKQKRDDEAAKVFAEMAQLKPDAAAPQLAMGLAAMTAGKLDDAFKAFQGAIKADPNSAQAHNNLGVVYERRGMLSEAKVEYRKALQLDPTLMDAKNNLGRFGDVGTVTKPTVKPVAKPTKPTSKSTKKK
ncbi:tetratricopeptide repeat protein [Armatimonas sp.]|uniref:tetratricopeptide repeat protein n=1 Tax=Armatimonas sp. TaxID=1872638 RepID=UPI00286B2A94|nr:tetratricopeptide repeat protein [Armatimonas sp.]